MVSLIGTILSLYIMSVDIISDPIESSDFENLQSFSFGTADIRLSTTDDNITLEYDDTVILLFTPLNSSFIPGVEGAGEFIRDTAVVNIIDNDSK